jgi:putative PIN family toxin of toxin-antitoxin system
VTDGFERIVPDTNFLVSAFILLRSPSAACLAEAQRSGVLLASPATLAELTDVLLRTKFDRYLSLGSRLQTLADFRSSVTVVEVSVSVVECRDPRDDKFLELALAGRADLILTGDDDLLAMHPWRGVEIITPAAYMAGR